MEYYKITQIKDTELIGKTVIASKNAMGLFEDFEGEIIDVNLGRNNTYRTLDIKNSKGEIRRVIETFVMTINPKGGENATRHNKN